MPGLLSITLTFDSYFDSRFFCLCFDFAYAGDFYLQELLVSIGTNLICGFIILLRIGKSLNNRLILCVLKAVLNSYGYRVIKSNSGMQSEPSRKRSRETAEESEDLESSIDEPNSFVDVEYLNKEFEEEEQTAECSGASTCKSADPLVVDYGLNLVSENESESDDDYADTNEVITTNSGFSQEKLPGGLYGCWLSVSVRDFKGHSSGKEVGKWGVAGDTVKDFLHNCWLLSKRYLKQEVLFRCDESGVAHPIWSTKTPQEADFVRFALFRDKSNHRYYTIDKVTVNLLQNWRKNDIYLLLHVYSLSVNNRSVFKTVKDMLLEPAAKDRAGAASNRAVEKLVITLRNKHGASWKAQDIAWMMWANAIFTAEPHLQESMTNEAPPEHLAKLFAAKEQQRLKAIRRSFAMAHNVNAGYHDEIVSIRASCNDLETTIQTLNNQMQLMKRRIEALETRDSLGQSFISAAEETLQATETTFSQSLVSRVSEQEDTDHL